MEIGESRDIVTLDSQRLMHVAWIFFYSATEWKTLEVRENPLSSISDRCLNRLAAFENVKVGFLLVLVGNNVVGIGGGLRGALMTTVEEV